MNERIDSETEEKENISQITREPMIKEITFQAYNMSKLDDELLKFAMKEIEAENPAVLNSKLVSDFELMHSNSNLNYEENEIRIETGNEEQGFNVATVESHQTNFMNNNYSVGHNVHISQSGNETSEIRKGSVIRYKRPIEEIFADNQNVSWLNKNFKENKDSFLKSECGNKNSFLENASVSKENLKQYPQTVYHAPTNNINRNTSVDSILNIDPKIGILDWNLSSEIPPFCTNPKSLNYTVEKNGSAATHQKPLNINRFAKLHVIDHSLSTNQARLVNQIPESFEKNGSAATYQKSLDVSRFNEMEVINQSLSTNQAHVDNEIPDRIESENVATYQKPINMSQFAELNVIDHSLSTNQGYVDNEIPENFGKNGSAATYQKPLNISRFSNFNFIDRLHSTNQGQKDVEFTKTKFSKIEENTKIKLNSNILHKTAISSKNCEEKNIIFVSKPDIHFARALGKEPSICSNCNTDFEKHWIMCEATKYYICCSCDRKYLRKRAFLHHIEIHGVEPFHCTACNVKFYGKGSHESDVTCKVCHQNFRCKGLLLEHSVVHTDDCMLCGKSTLNHGFNEKNNQRLKCCRCKITGDRRKLWSHFFTHFREKAYRCKICSQRFCREDSLKVHSELRHKIKINETCEKSI